MLLPGRHGAVDSYRYGFQGQEIDPEIKPNDDGSPNANSINYKFRMHDPRLGRFFAIDPMEAVYNWLSPYAFSGNRIIDAFEMEGLQPFRYTKGNTVVAGVKFKVTNKTDIKSEAIDKMLEGLKLKFKTALSVKIQKTTANIEFLEGAIIIDNDASYEILFLPKKEFEATLLAEKKATQKQIDEGTFLALANDIKGNKIYVSDETLGAFTVDWFDANDLLPYEREDLDDASLTLFHEVVHILGLLHTYDDFAIDANGKLVTQISSISKLWKLAKVELKEGTLNKKNSATKQLAKNVMTMGQEGQELLDWIKFYDSEVAPDELTPDQIETIYNNIQEYVKENKKED
jgi:hypothetical protein